MNKSCSHCGSSEHNIRSCTWANIKIGDSLAKREFLNKFKGYNYKKWEKDNWVNIPVKTKIIDNKYICTSIDKYQHHTNYLFKSRRLIIKWTEIKTKRVNYTTNPRIKRRK